MLFGKTVNRYYIKYLHYFVLGILALVAVDFFQLEIPRIIGEIIDGLKDATLSMDQLSDYVLDMMLIILVLLVGRFLWRLCIFGNGRRIETDMRDRMFNHSVKLSQSYYQKNKVGAMMALYTNDLGTIRETFSRGTMMFFDALIMGIIAFTKMIRIDLVLSLFALIPLIIVAVISNVVGGVMRKKFKARQQAYADLSDFTQENFSGIAVVKAFVKEGKELLEFSKRNRAFAEKNIEFVKTATLLRILIGALTSSVVIIIIGYGGYLIFLEQTTGVSNFTVGRLTEYISYFTALIWPMMAIANLINLSNQGKASLQRVEDLLNHEIEVKDSDTVIEKTIEGKITFNHLTFTYPDSQKPVLQNISFTINKGEHVGMIGRTGCGKTTLVDLLTRIYNLDENVLLIDDIDIMHLGIKNIRDAIAYVPQDGFLFSDTIKNNIQFAFKDEPTTRVVEAARMAGVHENIVEFSQGYDTILGERGVTVSGGQKQRIAIARAFMKNSPILILDDSVSAVDTKTEEEILENLKKSRANKTTILIAHRITTIQSMDKIVLLDEGRVVGVGTHDELLATSALYQRMVDLQRLEDEVEGEAYA